MSRLVVAFFKHPQGAKKIRSAVKNSYGRQLIDACAVVRNKDGAMTVHQTKDRADNYLPYGLLLGGIAGVLAGWFLWNAITGLIVGAVLGGLLSLLWGMLSDYGIDDYLIERLGSYLKPETSALFMLYKGPVPPALVAMLKESQAVVIHTPLNNQAEEALRLQLRRLQHTVPSKGLPVYTIDFNQGPSHA